MNRTKRRLLSLVLHAVLSMALTFSLPTGVAGAQGIILPPFPCLDEPFPLPRPLPVPEPAPLPRPLPFPQPMPMPAPSAGTGGSAVPDTQVIRPIEPIEPIRPIPVISCGLTIRYHRVNVDIADQVATTRVDQLFVNDSGRDLEGTYVFPLPEDAAITAFSMFVDGEEIEGQVLTKEEARRLYESIVRRNRDPALLEFVGRGAFQARVFPVPAGGERRIQLQYSQVLPQDNSLVRYVYPMTGQRATNQQPQQTSVTVSIASRRPITSIYSPSHEIAVSRTGETAAEVTWESGRTEPRKNFDLVYGVSPDPVGLHILTHRPDGEDGYFLVLAAPTLQATARTVPKDVSLIFDTSGSMAGAKIDQAKQALRFVVNRLNPEDRFNIIAFSSTVNTFANTMQPVSERNRALEFVDKLVASGGTNIDDALVTALNTNSAGRLHTVIFVTDGLPTVGPQQPEQILANAKRAAGGSGPRVFTFGVGYDVNTTLLDKLAADFGGVSAYVKPNENLEEAISFFYDKVGSPVLTNLRLDFGNAGVYDLFPTQLPDLYRGGQLIVAGRYRRPGTEDVTLTGTSDDRTLRFTSRSVTFAAGPTSGQASLPRLWASRKIGFLLSEIRLRGANPELVNEIVSLATRYGIATPYTSIFVPEPGTGPVPPPRVSGAPSAPGAAVPFSAEGRAATADALRQGLAAAPTAGPSAVQSAQQTQALKEASTAPSAPTERVRFVGDKTFVLADGSWTDVSTGTEPPPSAERRTLVFGSDEYFAFVDAHPDLAAFLSLGTRVLFSVDGTWVEVVEDL
jgi:Ca-activated chloride channel homolog